MQPDFDTDADITLLSITGFAAASGSAKSKLSNSPAFQHAVLSQRDETDHTSLRLSWTNLLNPNKFTGPAEPASIVVVTPVARHSESRSEPYGLTPQ